MGFVYGGLLAAAFLISSASAQAQIGDQAWIDEPLVRAIADAAAQETAPGLYAYVRHTRIDSKDEVLDRVEHFDPARSDGDRWDLLMENGQVPDDDRIRIYKKDNKEGDGAIANIYRDIIADLDPREAELIEKTDTEAVYRLLNIKRDLLSMVDGDLSDHLENRLVVDLSGSAPFVSSLRFYAPRPMKKGMVAKVRTFETVFAFMRHDRTMDILPREIRVAVSVEALLFFDIEAFTQIAFSDFEVREE